VPQVQLWVRKCIEISDRKFLEIYANLPGNLLKNFFHFIRFNYNNMHLLIFHLQLLKAFSSTTSTLHGTSQWCIVVCHELVTCVTVYGIQRTTLGRYTFHRTYFLCSERKQLAYSMAPRNISKFEWKLFRRYTSTLLLLFLVRLMLYTRLASPVVAVCIAI